MDTQPSIEVESNSESELDRLDLDELGVETIDELPLVLRPAVTPSPLVISYPHVGLDWKASFGPRPQVSFARNADFGVHQLFALDSHPNATHVIARYSRLAVDLNRSDDDVDPQIVPDHPSARLRLHPSGRSNAPLVSANQGVVWKHARGNLRLFETLPYEIFRRRIEEVHRPYYRSLGQLLERRRKKFGFAVLLDAHSMGGENLPDFALGTLGGESCSAEIRNAAISVFDESNPSIRNFSLGVDSPYWGGNIVAHFGDADRGIHALQLEVHARLFLNSARNALLSVPKPSSSKTLADATRSRQSSLRRVASRLNELQSVLSARVRTTQN